MRILFCVRHNFFEVLGGAYVQMLKTKEYLEKLGLECDLTNTPNGIDINKYDIVHLSDLTWIYDSLLYLSELDSFKGKKVISTIYWPFDDYAANGAPFIPKLVYKTFGINGFEYLKSLAKFITRRNDIYLKGIGKTYIQNQINIVNAVDWLLPNSQMEMNALNDRLGLDNKNYTIVHNAIDTKMYDDIMQKNNIIKKPDLITFVARIDPRKNQLNFLKAMLDTDYRIRFIGNPSPNYISYFNQLKKLASKRGNVEFISHLSQKELFKHYLEAKVNVLTSWIETPGLVSLEAAYAGCNLVVSDKGSVRDYFRDYAFYCMPDDIENIKLQTIKAMESDFNENFRSLIHKEYTWSKASEQTLEGYERALDA